MNGEQTQPLWLPEGSIRGIITLTLVLGCLVIYAWKDAIPETLATALGLVIREYFASREVPGQSRQDEPKIDKTGMINPGG